MVEKEKTFCDTSFITERGKMMQCRAKCVSKLGNQNYK